MKIITWTFDSNQELLTAKSMEQFSSEQLLRVVTSCCFELHAKETRNIDITELKKYSFIRDVMIHMSERLEKEVPSKEVIMLLINAIKRFIYFE